MPDEEWNGQITTVCLIDWAEQYLDFAKANFVEKTYNEKKVIFKRFFKQIDPMLPVEALSRYMVLNYIQEQMKTRSGYSANKDRKNLVAAWHWGMEYIEPRLPSPNPCLVRKMPEIRHPRYIPTEEDFWKVYEQTEGQDRVMLLAFLHLAGRRGEIFRLQTDDLDFDNNRVRLWTRKRKDGNLESDWLPMTNELQEAFRWWLDNRQINDTPYVFICTDQTPFCEEHYGKPFQYRLQFMRRLCAKAGVKRFGFHAIRHLTASMLFKQGYNVATIQAILRHQSPNTTERYLKTLGLEYIRGAMEKVFNKVNVA
jgi:integrase